MKRSVLVPSVIAAVALVLAVVFLPGGLGGRLHARILPEPGESMPRVESPANLATGKFLVARGSMRDPNFSGTVIYLIRYNDLGALGVVLNRPTEIRLSDALPHLEWLRKSEARIMWGGPVERHRVIILALSKEPIAGADHVYGNLYAGWDINVFRKLFEEGTGEIKAVRVFGGYAGWAPGQLAAEVERGGWLVVEAPIEEIFRDTSRLWYRLTGRR